MKKMLTFIPIDPPHTMYRVERDQYHLLGTLYKDVDGYYYLDVANWGVWPAHLLREIADKLDELNKPMDEFVAIENPQPK